MKKTVDIALFVAPLVALTLVITFVVFNIVSLFEPRELVPIKTATLEETVTLDGFIFRDETVLVSGGQIEKIYCSDGEKIPAGAVVASDGSDIISDRSGYFYTQVDGYESIFTSAAALGLNVDNFDTVTTENSFDDSKHAKPTQKPGAFAKVATDFKWYFAAKSADTGKFKSGETYTAAIGGANVELTLVRVSAGDGSAVLVFESGDIPSGKFFDRATAATVTVAYHTGAAVPSDAVHDIDRLKYVYIFDDGFARRRAVNLIFEQDGVCVIESKNIDDGDLVIIAKNLYDGKVMH